MEQLVCVENFVRSLFDEALLSGFQLPFLDSLILGEETCCRA